MIVHSARIYSVCRLSVKFQVTTTQLCIKQVLLGWSTRYRKVRSVLQRCSGAFFSSETFFWKPCNFWILSAAYIFFQLPVCGQNNSWKLSTNVKETPFLLLLSLLVTKILPLSTDLRFTSLDFTFFQLPVVFFSSGCGTTRLALRWWCRPEVTECTTCFRKASGTSRTTRRVREKSWKFCLKRVQWLPRFQSRLALVNRKKKCCKSEKVVWRAMAQYQEKTGSCLTSEERVYKLQAI